MRPMRILGVTLVAVLLVSGISFGQTAMRYVDQGPFPDTTAFKLPGGVINGGVAVDPAGKVWIQTYLGSTDTLDTGEATGAIYVFEADGTPASFSPIKILSGVDENSVSVTDTLDGSGYGMTTDPSDGTILSVKWSTRLWRIDYLTGDGIRRIQNPIPGYTSSLAGAAVNDFGEIFLGPVLPGGAVQILNPDFSQSTQVAAAEVAFGRSISVSGDGNDVFVPRFTALKTYVYHSDNGSLGPYTLADSVFLGASVESITRHPVTGHIWASADRRSTKDSTDLNYTWTPNTYYGYDPVGGTLADSFTVPTWDPAGPLPRGIAFSPTGDTVYVGHFDAPAEPAVRRFIRVLVGVQRIDEPIPGGFELKQNFPNPFNPSTEIRFTVPESGRTTLIVYDMLGREVRGLVNGHLAAGSYSATFNAGDLASGTYVYVLSSGSVRMTKKMVLMK